MNTDQRYVIFYCDECDLLKPAITIFQSIHHEMKAYTFSDIDALITQVEKKKPEMILVYFQDSTKSYMEVVKKIRENLDNTTIPIRIYRDLPDAQGLESIFKQL